MGATQGVILLMMGALALYLMWNSKSPFNKGGGSGSNDSNGAINGQHTQPGDPNPRSVPDQCLGLPNDYWCPGPPGIGDHYVNGVLVHDGHPNQADISQVVR